MQAEKKMLILVLAVVLLAASNLVLILLLSKTLYEDRRNNVSPPPSQPSKQNPPLSTSNKTTSNTTTTSNQTSPKPPPVSVSVNATNSTASSKTSQVNVTTIYTYYPVTYYLEIETRSNYGYCYNETGYLYYCNESTGIPNTTRVDIISMMAKHVGTICPVDMSTRMEMGTAYLNITLPLPGDKCYTIVPILTNRTKTLLRYRLALKEDPKGICGYCATILVRVSYLPPGHYTVTVGPEIFKS